MAIKHVYVDPSIDTDTGDGLSISTPYGRLSYALSTETENTAGGTQFNIKSGASVVQGATRLDTQLTWSPTVSSPVYFRGYDTSLEDGGVFDWDLDDNSLWDDASTKGNHLHFIDGRIHNLTTAGTAFNVNDYCSWQNIHFENLNVVSSAPVNGDNYITIKNCRFTNITATYHILALTGMYVSGCFFDGQLGAGNAMIYTQSGGIFDRNIFICADASGGWNSALTCLSNSWRFTNNSLYKIGKSVSGTGIYAPVTRHTESICENNLFENFTEAIRFGAEDSVAHVLAGNAFFDNTSNLVNARGAFMADNEALASTPYAKSGDMNYANRATWFAPADIGNVRTGAQDPYATGNLSKGAVQFAGAGGSSGAQLHPLGSQ